MIKDFYPNALLLQEVLLAHEVLVFADDHVRDQKKVDCASAHVTGRKCGEKSTLLHFVRAKIASILETVHFTVQYVGALLNAMIVTPAYNFPSRLMYQDGSDWNTPFLIPFLSLIKRYLIKALFLLFESLPSFKLFGDGRVFSLQGASDSDFLPVLTLFHCVLAENFYSVWVV